MPTYPHEERRQLILAVLRVLAAEHGRAEDLPAEREYADDMLDEAAVAFAAALTRYRHPAVVVAEAQADYDSNPGRQARVAAAAASPAVRRPRRKRT